ncbi:MAG: hypothetical protein GY711_21465 [bacterium]|nr:hypothetical protein [bacterium]
MPSSPIHILAAFACLSSIATAQTEIRELVASDGEPGDSFAEVLAVSGGRALVGAPDDDPAGDRSGSAYVFDVASGQQLSKLTPTDGAADDMFGIGVAIDGPLAVVGASGDGDHGAWSGSAYVFDVATGLQLFKLTANDAAAGHGFGADVGLSGNLAVVGAPGADGVASESGAAYVFDVTTGAQVAKLMATDGVMWDNFGSAVAIHGDRALVGARYHNAVAHESGAAYLFDVSTGSQVFKWIASDAGYRREFGTSLAMSGGWAVVGSPWNDSVGNGSAYVFDVATGAEWTRLLPADGQHGQIFGYSVGISGSHVLLGAWGEDVPGSSAGSAYLFDFLTGEQLVKLQPSDVEQGDYFGYGVALEHETALVGAFGDGNGAAHVIDTDQVGTVFCASTANSTGAPGRLEASGTTVAIDDDVTLRAFGLPPHQTVFFLASDGAQPSPVAPPFGGGLLCIGPMIGRMYRSPSGASLIGNSGPGGEFSIATTAGDWSTQEIPAPSGAPYAAAAGTSSYFQAWHRDVHPTSPGTSWSGLTDGLRITWF